MTGVLPDGAGQLRIWCVTGRHAPGPGERPAPGDTAAYPLPAGWRKDGASWTGRRWVAAPRSRVRICHCPEHPLTTA